HLARQRRRLLQAGRQRRRRPDDRCGGRCRQPRGVAEGEPAADALAGSEAMGTELPRRSACRRRGPAGGATCLYDREQGDRAAHLGDRRLEAVGHSADFRSSAGRQPALLAAPGPRLCARRTDRYRLSLGHRQRCRLAARRDLIAAEPIHHSPAPAIVRTPSTANTAAATRRIALMGSLPANRSPSTTTGMLASIMPRVVPSTTG